MKDGRVRLAIIGCGGICMPHIEGYVRIKDKAEIVACVDVVREAAEAHAARAGGNPRIYTDWNEMLRAEKDLEAVDIMLPHHLHRAAITDAANAGKHIICEKPLCLNLKEADEIEAVVKKAGVIYMSAHNQLFDPCVREAKAILDSGIFGKPYCIMTRDCWKTKRHFHNREAMGWRADVKKQGGGELIDTGYHPSYLLLYLADSKVKQVSSVMGTFDLDMDAEDTAIVIVKFANGVIGQVFTSWAMYNPAGSHQIHIMCDRGQIYGSGRDLYLLPNDFSEPAHRRFEGPADTFHLEVEHFVDCVLSGRQPVATLKAGRDVLEMILEAHKSARG